MTDRQPVTVRPATPNDAEQIASLFTDEGYPAGPSDIVERLGENYEYGMIRMYWAMKREET